MTRYLLRILALSVILGCGEDSPSGPASGSGPTAGAAVPVFSIPDVNSTSPRHGEMVSPRDYVSAVSAWYFGHAT